MSGSGTGTTPSPPWPGPPRRAGCSAAPPTSSTTCCIPSTRPRVKVHRSLDVGGDGCVYGATSSLSGLDAMAEAPGGKLFKLDPATGQIDVLGVPVPHLYIQTISLDATRKMIYGMAYPAFTFFAFSLEKRELVYSRYVGSISHIAAVDPLPGSGLSHPVPEPDVPRRRADRRDDRRRGRVSLHRARERRAVPTRLANGSAGVPRQAHAGHAPAGPGGGGGRPAVRCRRGRPGVHRKTGRSEVLGEIRDERSDTACFRTHDCCLLGTDLYVGETDNPERGCFLWKCSIA